MASFKDMQRANVIKRADKSLIRYDDIHVAPGFNLRDLADPDFEADLQALELHMASGGKVPALEVIPRDAGGVELVDGHRRHIVIGRLIAKGQPIEWIEITQFIGNDMQRLARIMTSNEGRKLKPLEIAEGYRRLAAFGLSSEDIARHVHKTRQHVDQMLILANAPHELQTAVKTGEISATDASKMARPGEAKAKEALADGRAKAKAQGKTKITGKVLKPWTPPATNVRPVVQALDLLHASLKPETRMALLNKPNEFDLVSVPAAAIFELLNQHGSIVELREKAEAKNRDKAAKAAQMAVPGADGA